MWNPKPYEEFFTFCYMKNPLDCLALWLDLLVRQDLVTCTGHLEFTGSLGYAGHLNANIVRKVFKHWEAFK